MPDNRDEFQEWKIKKKLRQQQLREQNQLLVVPPANSATLSDVWDIRQFQNNEDRMKPIQIFCQTYELSLNDYLWLPFWEITTHYENQKLLREKQIEEIEQQRLAMSNQEQELDDEPEEGPIIRPITDAFKKEIVKLIQDIDGERTLIGRPSCSFEKCNLKEYKDCELFKLKDVVTAFNAYQPTNKYLPANQDLPRDTPLPGSYPGKDSEFVTSPFDGPTPIFPNARSERIYHYVQEVLRFYESKRIQYEEDKLDISLSAYKLKADLFQLAFEENHLGIRDAISPETLDAIDMDTSNVCLEAIGFIENYYKAMQACINEYVVLVRVKENMIDGCFDRETLSRAKIAAKKMVIALKITADMIFESICAVKNVYGNIMEFNDILRDYRTRPTC